MFRLLKEYDRKNAFDFVTLLYEQGTGKAESAYSTYSNEDSKRTNVLPVQLYQPNLGCQRRFKIVRKRRRNFVVFRRGEW